MAEKDVLDDTKWIDDFQTQQQADDELAKTANEFLSNVNDPQLANSEVNLTRLQVKCSHFIKHMFITQIIRSACVFQIILPWLPNFFYHGNLQRDSRKVIFL